MDRSIQKNLLFLEGAITLSVNFYEKEIIMNNHSIADQTTFHKCLSLLPFHTYSSAYFDNSVKKLFTVHLMRIGLAIQLGGWKSYAEMQERIRGNKDAKELFGVTSISGSQISRRFNALPTTYPQRLFFEAVRMLNTVNRQKGIGALGRLHVIDSSFLRIGATLAKWAYVSRDRSGVKLHTRLLVTSEDIAYPDKVIPSTGNVDDREAVLQLLTDPDVTALMDRGYVDYAMMSLWIEQEFKFIIRINAKHVANILETYEIAKGSSVCLDAKATMGTKAKANTSAVRIVEFVDDTGKLYRLATNRWDLSAEEIAEAYRHRWLIETLFKWLKQHLRLVQLQSTKPQGIWNQIFFAMTAFCLVMYIRLEMKTTKTPWQVLVHLRIYAALDWQTFQHSLHREPGRTSLGRRKVQPQEKEQIPLHLDDAGIAIIKPVGEKRSKTAKYLK